MKVLVIDNDTVEGLDIQKSLLNEDWSVDLVDEDRVTGAFEKTRLLLLESQYDVMVLDIGFRADLYGGIQIYNDLSKESLYRDRWTHTIIYTQHTTSDIRRASQNTSAFPIRIFAETAQIPFQNVLNNKTQGRAPLIRRIKELRLPPT